MEKQDAIISFITEEKILDEKALEGALEQQQKTGQNLISILKEQNLLSEGQLTRVIAAANKIEFINLSPEMIDPAAARLVSYKTVSRHSLIPVKKDGDKLVVAMSSPLNLSVRDKIEMKTGCKVVPVAAMPEAIQQAIHYHFNVEKLTEQTMVSMDSKHQPSEIAADRTDQVLEETLAKVEQKLTGTGNAPIAELVSSVIRGAIDARASDIHFEPQSCGVRVRYRIDGILRDAIEIPLSAQLKVISHIKITSDMDISERRVPQDGHITVPHGGKAYDLRVSSLPAVGGEKIVIRILDKDANKWTLDTVVASPDDNRKVRELINSPYGMLLLTGPTGSGKTTTLYSILQLLNGPERNIVTIEDPVEYRLEGITQVQIKPAAGITFAPALRSILRQDPDIILVGEIRDLETAEIAISAALTGHLVLSTLHTNDAAGAISRLINLGVPPFLVSSALLGVVAQRLIRISCSNCKQAYQPSEDELNRLPGQSCQDRDIKLHKGAGCKSCYHTGYHGRKGIYEILGVSGKIRRMIVDGCSDDTIKQQAIEEGMKTLKESGVDKVINGKTTLSELMRVIDLGAD